MNAPAHVLPFATPLQQACEKLAALKLAEHEANLARLAAENEVLALVGQLPDEGTSHHDAPGWRATVTTSIRRSVDTDKLTEIAAQIPDAIGKRLIKWKPELVTRELRFVQNNEPELYSVIAQAIEAKPAKPSVRVERVEEAA